MTTRFCNMDCQTCFWWSFFENESPAELYRRFDELSGWFCPIEELSTHLSWFKGTEKSQISFRYCFYIVFCLLLTGVKMGIIGSEIAKIMICRLKHILRVCGDWFIRLSVNSCSSYVQVNSQSNGVSTVHLLWWIELASVESISSNIFADDISISNYQWKHLLIPAAANTVSLFSYIRSVPHLQISVRLRDCSNNVL